MPEVTEIKLSLVDAEPIQAILTAAAQLARKVDWFLDDSLYTAPEAPTDNVVSLLVLHGGVEAFKAAVRAQGGDA